MFKPILLVRELYYDLKIANIHDEFSVSRITLKSFINKKQIVI